MSNLLNKLKEAETKLIKDTILFWRLPGLLCMPLPSI